jgi:chemotaxis protein histidine kinase CheA
MTTRVAPASNRAKYDEVSAQFWKLQQVEQTAEEREYEELCHELEQMLNAFREELMELEHENQRLQSEYESCSNLRDAQRALRDEEVRLLALRRDWDLAERS